MFLQPERLDQIIALGRQNLPNEICGILVNTPQGQILRQLTNQAEDPTTGYYLDNQELVQELTGIVHAQEITLEKNDVVVWHTHPSGFIGPSDRDLSTRNLGLTYLVVALPNGEATFF